MTKVKKPNKRQREIRRAHDAEVFREGFDMGYRMGIEQGRRDEMTSGVPSLWDGGTPSGHFKITDSECE